MDAPVAVLVPLLSPNELESRLAAIHAPEGTHVNRGQPLVTLETANKSVDVKVEVAGYVADLRARVGDVLRAGDRLCWLASASDWVPPRGQQPAGESPLPVGPLAAEAQLQDKLAGAAAESTEMVDRRMIVYGGGGHGKAVIEAVCAVGIHEVVGVVDDGLPRGSQVLGLPVLGGAEALAGLLAQGIHLAANGVGGIGDAQSRVSVFRRLAEAGFSCPAVVHPAALVEPSASLSPGVQVMPLAYVGSEAQIGFGVLINTSAVVSHDCCLAAHANVSPGALLAGGVRIGEAAQVGMGATVNVGVVIGDGARVGNSAVVKKDVPPGGIVRAGSVWPERETASS